MGRIAIIGGTGFEEVPSGWSVESVVPHTPHGPVTASILRAEGREIVFLPRHGAQHQVAPHRIDYRANIAALVALGVTDVLATNAAGSLRGGLAPGALVLLSDFIDFTRQRGASYWDDAAGHGVVHTDFSAPYSPRLRNKLIASAAILGVKLVEQGIYLCVEGPRYESPAEVRLFASWGADVVGMTGLPEAVFAREAGLEYAAVAVVTNFGTGISSEALSHEDVLARMAESASVLRELLLTAARA